MLITWKSGSTISRHIDERRLCGAPSLWGIKAHFSTGSVTVCLNRQVAAEIASSGSWGWLHRAPPMVGGIASCCISNNEQWQFLCHCNKSQATLKAPKTQPREHASPPVRFHCSQTRGAAGHRLDPGTDLALVSPALLPFLSLFTPTVWGSYCMKAPEMRRTGNWVE